MTDYTPPLQDMSFVLHDVLGFSHPEYDRATCEAILEEAGKLARDVLAPLNHSGDAQGAVRHEDGSVKTAAGFKEAYAAYRDGGWNAVPFDATYGGQGLPWAMAFPVQEMWQAANMSFGLCPLLNQGAVEAILSHGSDAQKEYYLPKLISGEWTGTMNLTEPQAGSDLGLIRSKAEPRGDATYGITGQKIFITYGEHDMAENIIHLVLARTPGAPEDVKGISLFIVPKFLEGGTRNAVKCIGLEHKLGIHASPTCTMDFDGATGYLIGQENEGLKYMFTMMNNARLSVGLQGVAIAERAYQHAQAYAAERMQGKALSGGNDRVNIAKHPDVMRMLTDMQAKIMAGRAMTYQAACALDDAHSGDTAARTRADVLTPLVKSWCTDMACDVTSTGVQIHGGMGFIEETGAAQYFRDARILPIYEGTNGIQALDLIFRKILRDGGAGADTYIGDLQTIRSTLSDSGQKAAYGAALETLSASLRNIVLQAKDGGAEGLQETALCAKDFLNGFATIAGGVLLALCADKSAGQPDTVFTSRMKMLTAHYVRFILPHGLAYLQGI